MNRWFSLLVDTEIECVKLEGLNQNAGSRGECSDHSSVSLSGLARGRGGGG